MHHYTLLAESTSTAVSYSSGHIVLSYVTSLLGCITTLELLQRRTSTRGAYNWFLLGAAAVTMGAISIWGMHFVAIGAIILAHGAPDRQILYKPGFTAISFFVPILVLLIAFYMLGQPARARQVHVAIASVLMGAAVCGMHSLGQYGLQNYRCVYKVPNLVGSAIISVLASFIALSVFFRLRDTWTDCWWKRVLCSAILALAKGDGTVHGRFGSQTTIVASSLSMGACIVLLAVAFIRGRRMHTARIKAQRLVLACAYFDQDGKLMVTEEGILPSEKITNQYLEKVEIGAILSMFALEANVQSQNFGEDELSRSQVAFLWVFKASRNWALLKEFLPAMADYIRTDPAVKRYRPGHTASHSRIDASEIPLNFAPVFKQLFCMAAQRLANHLHEPLEQLGVLFEEPLETGALFLFTPSKTALADLSPQVYATTDVESGHCIARGKYLFLTRQLKSDETAKFAALGYRFAAVARIAEPMAKRMQINRDNLVARMKRMQLSVSPDHLPSPGVHLACFILRPSVYTSFDVLVPESVQNQLPHTTIQPHELTAEQSQQLTSLFDESTVTEALRALEDRSSRSELDADFGRRLHRAIMKLVDVMGDSDSLMQARMSARPFQVPCQPDPGDLSPPTCTFLIMRMMRDVHASSARKELVYVPLSAFRVQQQYLTAGWRDEQFAREVNAEFGHLRQDSVKWRRFNSMQLAPVQDHADGRDANAWRKELMRAAAAEAKKGPRASAKRTNLG
ncbi:hypothetical protein A1O3_05009 [Capronia epimyces CBS 606.96]|uniref:MHYT domain-containing protein n=1 Tax=Capronia epimyces CBS 606.96 TaxID=1182542 RepID=W9XUY8_9EURO|nr:uncharacterized protein A1O3_05009 [Capronia epimyces CBS 606.96]EXJ84342.1 hypothetical protein A1O3_05009 [Capronia epimyces CBS 606.96]